MTDIFKLGTEYVQCFLALEGLTDLVFCQAQFYWKEPGEMCEGE